jgi:hypothetical protein
MRPYKFWFDTNLGKWLITPDGPAGGILQVDNLRLCEVDIETNGRVMHCTAELLADGSTLRLPDKSGVMKSKRAVLRLLRIYDQMVHIPVVAKAEPRFRFL